MRPASFSLLLFPGFEELPPAAFAAFEVADFSTERPDEEGQNKIMLQALKHIEQVRSVTEDGPNGVGVGATLLGRYASWERCYAAMLEGADLTPPFLIKEAGTPIRINGHFEIPRSERFEADFLAVVRAFLFHRYFSGLSAVYEFGCGSGHNLLALGQQITDIKHLVGLEWSKNAVKLVDATAARTGLPMVGRFFDFFNPDKNMELDRQGGVLTVGALEQVGKRWDAFLAFLLCKKPAICVHLEPCPEKYDETHLFDFLALKYHRKRGYLEGFYPALRAFEKRGSLEILAAHRIRFGSLYHEAYTYIVWRPR